MVFERFGLRSWLLLAIGGWALLVWAAALFGLGGRVGTIDDEGTAPPVLPEVPTLAADRPAAAGDAAVVAERPLFAADRKPHPFRATQAQGSSSTLRLTGVLLSGEFGLATFTTEQNQSVRLRLNGEAVDGWQLLSLEPRRATVLGPEGAQVLELNVFDGQGGEAPTVLASASAASGPAQAAAAQRDQQGRAAAQAAAVAAANAAASAAAAAAGRDAAAQRPTPPAPAGPANQGPSEEQMQAIRERIRARREQLRQQQQQTPSPAPGGAGANR